MTEVWKQCEGQVVDEKFCLRQYLSGRERSAVFLTERGDRERQIVAIKLVLTDPEEADTQLARWERVAKLSHPHLMRLFVGGRCYLRDLRLLYVVMEYADQDLSHVLPDRPLTAEETREMLEPAVSALAYVHGEGFVHGHLKPANIMAVDDQLKVSSDGLLPAGESIRGPVKPGVYDPPEIAGEGISPAGDVWSLGVTVVEALTQRPPVWNGTEQTGAGLPEILPDPFVDIAHHCLQADPQRRWTVADIAARLQQTSAPPREHKSANPPGAFQRRYVLPAAALGLALAGILAVPALRNRRPQSHVASPALLDEASVRTGSELKPVTPEAVETARGSDKQPASLATDGAGRLQSKVEAKTGAGGLVAGKVVHQVLPSVAPKASDTIQGKVRVRLRISVDPSGNVAYAKLDSPGPSRYFADLALHAAQRWRFDPAKVDGRPVTSEWILRFEFAKTGAKAFPVQTAP